MKFRLLIIKRALEDLMMLPLIMIGRLLATLKPLKEEFQVFYFFPFYHTGGAEKVHALIAKATGNDQCIVFFTRKSHNTAFLEMFRESGCILKDVSRYTDNKAIYFVNIIFRGIISGYINAQKQVPIVFNGQCNFGYKISPWIRKDIRQIELIHSISNFSYIRIPFLPFIDKTVMISKEKITEHFELYIRYAIPAMFKQKVYYIPNASEFQSISIKDKDLSTIRVLYSGRATPEKRPQLVARIAEEVHRHDPAIQFVMAGDTFDDIQIKKPSFVEIKGNITNKGVLSALYQQCNILLITSSTEGFPLAIIEGMAYGNAIIATPVGDIPAHVKSGQNGFLLSQAKNEDKIIQEATTFILQLKADRELLQKIVATNISYAQTHFSFQRFAADYQKLIFT
jgi:L-malate glycosyltransferase